MSTSLQITTAKGGRIVRGPEELGDYVWLGMYRASTPWKTRWFLTRAGMLRWFEAITPPSRARWNGYGWDISG